jgi:ADP-ribosyl-[dinitrogen reductase] hydrolase
MRTEPLEALVDRAASAGGTDQPTLRSRYRGTLLGVAAGNALGLQVEGESRNSIRRRHPDGVREVDPRERDRPWDDDLAQTVLLAEALLEMEDLDLDYLGMQLARWRAENGRGIGVLTAEVLDEIERGAPARDAARIVWERSGWSTAGNGALMRCAPVALRWRASGAALVRAARASAQVTHYDARCVWSTVVFDVALAIALSTGTAPDPSDLADALEGAEQEGEAGAAVEQVVEATRAVTSAGLDDLDLDDPMDMGYTLKALQVGLWALRAPGDLESLVAEVVEAGGDTDTNAAVAGAALGARVGEQAIPGRWLGAVARTDELVRVADRLLDAAR